MPEIGLYEAMSTLRAVRRLKPDPIPDDVLHRVLRAATWAPTGGNRQGWRIIAVKDPALKARLGELYVRGRPEFIKKQQEAAAKLPPGERERAERQIRASTHLAYNYGKTPVLAVICFDPSVLAFSDSGLKRPSVVGGGSIYPAVQNVLLACRAEGLGCVLTTVLCQWEPEVKEVLGIPDPWGIAAVVPIGYPMGGGHGPISRNSVKEMAFLDKWGKAIE
jgi:nitroreductase